MVLWEKVWGKKSKGTALRDRKCFGYDVRTAKVRLKYSDQGRDHEQRLKSIQTSFLYLPPGRARGRKLS